MCTNCMKWSDDLGIVITSATGPGRRHKLKSPYVPKRVKKAIYLEMRMFTPPERIEYEEGKHYTQRELDQLADQFLRDDAKSIDAITGKAKGIQGDNPILFEEHLRKRASREIGNERGVADPAYTLNSNGQPGMYNRVAPDGRKVNSEEQRRRNGASFFRN